MVAAGMAETIDANLGEKLKRIARTAAMRITLGSNTFVIFRTPVFSP